MSSSLGRTRGRGDSSASEASPSRELGVPSIPSHLELLERCPQMRRASLHSSHLETLVCPSPQIPGTCLSQ